MKCSIAECDRPVHSRGYCKRHYCQMKRGTLDKPLEDRDYWICPKCKTTYDHVQVYDKSSYSHVCPNLECKR